MLIRDKVIFGGIAGILAHAAMDIFQVPLWKLRLLKHPLSHYAASLFMTPEMVHHTLGGTAIGILTDYIYGALWGIVFVYFIEATGKRYFMLKGLIFGAFLWLFSFGTLRALPIVTLREVVPGQTIYYLGLHLLLGLVLGVLVKIHERQLQRQDRR